MIVDCHTQIWETATHFPAASSAMAQPAVHADASRHIEAVDPVDRAIVLAFKSRYLGAEIPNQFVADYVRRYSAKLIGFAGVDPTDPTWPEELRVAREDMQLKGVTLSPGMQNYHPVDTRAMRLYEQCVLRHMPVVFEQNHRSPAAKLEFARPLLLDEVAREFPDLRIVVSHMGYPWIDETIVLLGKHRNVFADIAGLHRRQWLTYNTLLTAHEYGVIDKLLFASDFPYRAPAECIEALYSLNQLSHGTNLMTIPREKLRGIVERDALSLLGIGRPEAAPRAKSGIFVEDE